MSSARGAALDQKSLLLLAFLITATLIRAVAPQGTAELVEATLSCDSDGVRRHDFDTTSAPNLVDIPPDYGFIERCCGGSGAGDVVVEVNVSNPNTSGWMIRVCADDGGEFDVTLSVFADAELQEGILLHDRASSNCEFTQYRDAPDLFEADVFYVMASGYQADRGSGSVSLDCNFQMPDAVVHQDLHCGDAIVGGTNAGFENVVYTDDNRDSGDVVYRWHHPGGSHHIEVSAHGSFDPVLDVFRDATLTDLIFEVDQNGEGENESHHSEDSGMYLDGGVYYVVVGGFQDHIGNFDLRVECGSLYCGDQVVASTTGRTATTDVVLEVDVDSSSRAAKNTCSFYTDRSYGGNGNQIDNLIDVSLETCCEACSSASTCLGYEFEFYDSSDSDDGDCRTFDALPEVYDDAPITPGTIAGFVVKETISNRDDSVVGAKGLVHQDIDGSGSLNGKLAIYHYVQTPLRCQELCNNDHRCEAWTLLENNNPAQCYLMHEPITSTTKFKQRSRSIFSGNRTAPSESTCTTAPGLLGNGECNDDANTAGCFYDHGDCCNETQRITCSSGSCPLADQRCRDPRIVTFEESYVAFEMSTCHDDNSFPTNISLFEDRALSTSVSDYASSDCVADGVTGTQVRASIEDSLASYAQVSDTSATPGGGLARVDLSCSSHAETTVPTPSPSTIPTTAPTSSPSTIPTSAPTSSPSAIPTSVPTSSPSTIPTSAPTPIPTESGGSNLVSPDRVEEGGSPVLVPGEIAAISIGIVLLLTVCAMVAFRKRVRGPRNKKTLTLVAQHGAARNERAHINETIGGQQQDTIELQPGMKLKDPPISQAPPATNGVEGPATILNVEEEGTPTRAPAAAEADSDRALALSRVVLGDMTFDGSVRRLRQFSHASASANVNASANATAGGGGSLSSVLGAEPLSYSRGVDREELLFNPEDFDDALFDSDDGTPSKPVHSRAQEVNTVLPPPARAASLPPSDRDQASYPSGGDNDSPHLHSTNATSAAAAGAPSASETGLQLSTSDKCTVGENTLGEDMPGENTPGESTPGEAAGTSDALLSAPTQVPEVETTLLTYNAPQPDEVDVPTPGTDSTPSKNTPTPGEVTNDALSSALGLAPGEYFASEADLLRALRGLIQNEGGGNSHPKSDTSK